MAEYENCSDQAEGQIVTHCQPCEKKQITMVADIYCDTCAEFQCRECSKGHEMFSFMAGHILTEVNQSTLPPSAVPVVDMKGLDMCVEHNKQFLYYCVDYDILLCSSCIVKNYGKYKHIQELDSDDIKSHAKPNQDLETIVSKLDDSAKSMLHDVNEAKQSIGQNLEGITNMIDEKRDSMIQQFEKLKVNVTTSISKKEQESDEKFDEMIAKSTATVDKVTIFRDILPDVLDHGTSTQSFIIQHVVSKHAEDFHAYKDTHTVGTCSFTLELSPLLTGLLTPNHQLATLKTSLKANEETQSFSQNVETNPRLPTSQINNKTDLPKTAEETKLEEKAVQTDNTSQPIQSESAARGPQQSSGQTVLKLLLSIDLEEGPGESGDPFYTGMDFLPDGRLVVVDNENDKLLIYSESLVKLGTYKLRGHRKSVSVISDNEIAVTGGKHKQIELFNISTTNRFKFLRFLSTLSESDSISLMNPTTVLVGNFDATPSMRMISLTDGNEEYFVNLKRKQYKFGNNRCTYVSKSDMLALTDRYAHTVYLYTRNGNHLTWQSVRHPSIQEPRDLCEGPDDSVIVCSGETDSLVQVSTTGTILASHKLYMADPYTVCMSRDGQRLAVSNNDDDKQLQVYQILHCTN